jgi:hypothetical protein
MAIGQPDYADLIHPESLHSVPGQECHGMVTARDVPRSAFRR